MGIHCGRQRAGWPALPHGDIRAISSLVPFPHQGHKRPDLTTRPLRFQAVRDYLIAYAPEEKPLLVIAVLHGRRNPQAISTLLEQRQ
jgi:plasmid stabilization system protein ParE